MNTSTLGIRNISGTYTRTSPNGFRTLSFNWYIDVNSIGECQLYTNDALTDCYTQDNAFFADSLDDCLAKIEEIIKEAVA